MNRVRRGLAVVVLSILVTVGFNITVNNAVANAWSGDLPQCTRLPVGWQGMIQSDSRFSNNTSWVAFERDWPWAPFTGYPAIVVLWDAPSPYALTFTGNGVDNSANTLSTPKAASFYKVIGDELIDISSSLPSGSYFTYSDLNCVDDAYGVDYVDWAGATYPNSQAGNKQYVAMGDSFSSGEGNPDFELGTAYSESNKCHRSPNAFPRLLQNDTSLDVGLTTFVACSGATTSSITAGGSGTGNWNEGPQLDALSTGTDIVTVTVGGNDIGFKEYIEGCIVAPCGPLSMNYGAVIDLIESSSFLANLEYTYEQILDEAENAKVYVIDYPYLTAESAGYCGVIDFSGGRGIQVALNAKIAQAVSNVQTESTDYSNRLVYVATNSTDSPFEGKYYCNGGDTDFYGAVAPVVYSFHPNTQGHIDYATVVADAIG